jgi:pilus assembly protein Flp/PilA
MSSRVDMNSEKSPADRRQGIEIPLKLYGLCPRQRLSGGYLSAILVITVDTERIWRTAKPLLADDSGQDMIEYALIAALIAVAAITALRGLTNKIDNEFNSVANSL